MLPQYSELGKTGSPKFRINFGKFAVIVVSLPLLSFIFCVIWSILFFFKRSTATHCDVPNYLPSISAAIGNYQPQRFIWQFAICTDIIPRLMIVQMYLQYYTKTIRKNRRNLAYLACFVNVIENFALLGLTLWTSVDDYSTHKFCFLLFILSSELYMFMSYLINKNARKTSTITEEEIISLKHKRNLFIVNLISFAAAGYFFLRHNFKCEPGVYTIFALLEYIVVLTNMGFHMTAYWDFHGRSLAFDWKRGLFFTYQ